MSVTTGIDDVITLSLSGPSRVGEDAGDVEYTVRLDGTNTAPTEVGVRIADESAATTPDDYEMPLSPLTIPAGVSSVTFTVAVVDDADDDDEERMIVELFDPSGGGAGPGGIVLAPGGALVTTAITDNDEVVLVALRRASRTVEEGGMATVVLSVSGEREHPVSVAYAITDPATLPENTEDDYTDPGNGVLVIPATAREGTITIDVPDDADAELGVLLSVEIESVGFGVDTDDVIMPAGPTVSTIDIRGSDAVVLSLAPPRSLEVAEGESAVFRVNKTAVPSDVPVSVQVLTAPDGTAANGTDYLVPVSVTVPAGIFSGRFVVQTQPDDESDPDETVEVSLGTTTPSGGVLVEPTTFTLTIVERNFAPTFGVGGGTVARGIPENSPAGAAIGAPVAAFDPEVADTLAYSLGDVADPMVPAVATLFGIGADGQITVASGTTLDHESMAASYTVVASVHDGRDSRGRPDPTVDEEVTVVVNVTDVAEPPPAPAAPAVGPAAVGGHLTLTVGWTAPAEAGIPPVTSYDIEHRLAGASDSDFTGTNVEHSGTDTAATVTGLSPSTAYQVRVRARNDEGVGEWSPAGDGTTGVGYVVSVAEPGVRVLEGETASVTVEVGAAAPTALSVGYEVRDRGAVVGTDFANPGGGSLTIAAGMRSGVIEFPVTDDVVAEPEEGLVVALTAVSQVGATPDLAVLGTGAETSVSIPANDAVVLMLEGPAPPDADEGAAAGFTIHVSGANNTAAVTVALSVGGSADPATDYTAPPGSVTVPAGATSVRFSVPVIPESPAVVDPGETIVVALVSPTGATPAFIADETAVTVTIVEANAAPSFVGTPGVPLVRSVPENSPAGTRVGAPVQAADIDSAAGALVYSLGPGDPLATVAVGSLFGIDGSGQITVAAGATLDHEMAAVHTVAVTVHDGLDARGFPDTAPDGTAIVVVSVADVDEVPAAPTALSVGPAAVDGHVTLAAGWTLPDTTGIPPVDNVALEYRENVGDADVLTVDVGVGSSAPIPGLVPGTEYVVRVRASNAEGAGGWSAPVLATTGNGVVVSMASSSLTMSEGETARVSVWMAPRQSANVTALFDVRDDGAVGDQDYTGPDSQSIVIRTGATRGSAAFPLVDDVLAEESEVFVVSLVSVTLEGVRANRALVGTPAETSVTIRANDGIVVSLSFLEATVTVGGTATLLVSVTGDVPAEVVDVSLAVGGSASATVDYVEPTGPLVLDPLALTGTVEFTVEPSATPGREIEIALTRASGGGRPMVVADRSVVTVTITDENGPPGFDRSTVTVTVAEDTAAGGNAGAAVTATDPDGHPLAYSLSGADASLFGIGETTGQLTVATGATLDHETQDSHTVVVSTRDSRDDIGVADASADASVTVVVEVSDVDEPPAAPMSLSVSSAAVDGHRRLVATWEAPPGAGHPPVTGYEVEWRPGAAAAYVRLPHVGAATRATIGGLVPGVAHDVRVRARNDEGTGPPVSATGTTGDGFVVSMAAAALDVDETAGNVDVTVRRAPSTALAADITATYRVRSLGAVEGVDYIVPASRAVTIRSAAISATISFPVLVDTVAEVDDVFVVELVDLESSGSPAILGADTETAVTILAHGAVVLSLAAPQTAEAGTTETVAVEFSGAMRTADVSVSVSVDGTALTNSPLVGQPADNLVAFDVPVSPAAVPGTEIAIEIDAPPPALISRANATILVVDPNTEPVFDVPGALTFTVSEDAGAGDSVGSPIAVTDGDGDSLSYSLSGGGGLFGISGSGQVTVAAGATLDFETEMLHTVVAGVGDRKDNLGIADGRIDITREVVVTVDDVDEPPAAPAAPAVATAAVGGDTGLSVGWEAPDTAGIPRITGYDIEHRWKDEDSFGPFTSAGVSHSGALTMALIRGLEQGTGYEVRVRAVNNEGVGAWSDIGMGLTDLILGRVAFSETTLTVSEGERALVTLSLSPPPTKNGAVGITETSGTGLMVTDYALNATMANIAAGATDVILTVDITDDTAVEGTETLTLGLSNPTGGVGLGAQQSVVLEIADNDFTDVSISFGAASYSGTEGGAVATVTVTVANVDPAVTTMGPQREVRIPITRMLRGDATDADHTGLPSEITLAADQVEATFEVTVVDDTDEDPGEELVLGFDTLPGNILAGDPATATIALIDNDSDWVTIAVGDSSGSPVTVLEPGVAVATTVTVDLFLGSTVAAATEVEVALSLPAGDIEAVGPLGTVTISLDTGDSTGSATGTITVRALADSVVEAPEVVPLGGMVSGGPAGIVVAPGAITVRDLVRSDIDDSNPLAGSATASDIDTATVSIGSAAAADEGATVTLTATIDTTVNVEVRASWSASSNASDLVSATGTVIFPARDTEQEILVTIADDSLNEGGETVEITLGAPQPELGGRIVAAPGAGIVSINASDRVPESVEAIVRLERVDGLILGGSFLPTLTTALPARLTLGTDRSTSTSRIQLNTYARITDPVGGVANPAVDRAGGRRVASVEGVIVLSGEDYTVNQIHEMAVAICVPSGGTGICGSLVQHPRLPPRYNGIGVWEYPAERIGGVFGHRSWVGGGPGVRCVTFPGAAANECEAFLYGVDLGGLLQFGDSHSGLLQLRPAMRQGVYSGFTIDGAPPSALTGVTVELCASSGCLSRVAFSETTLTVGEGDGQALVTLTVDPAPAAAGTVTITETTGTGLGTGDYSLAATVVTVAAGASEVVLTVDITDDAAVEDPETLTLSVSGAAGGVGLGMPQSVVLEITDDDFNDVSISFGASSYSGTEGGVVATVTVTVANVDPAVTTTGPQQQVTIPITRVLRRGATDVDYTGLPSEITLTADQEEATFEVRVVDDRSQDPGEELVLGFGALPPNVLAGTPAEATVALVDNDTDDWVAIAATDSSGSPVTVLEPGVAVATTVSVDLFLGSTVTAATEVEVAFSLPAGDIEVVGSLGTVTISLGTGDSTGSATGTITVRASADSVVEAPEVVPLGGTASGGPAGIVVAPGAITVRDLVQSDIDDSNPLAGSSTASDIDTATVSIGSAAAADEGATVTLTATIDQTVNVDVRVPWSASTNAGDVVAATGTVVFPARDTEQEVRVTIMDDGMDEGVEAVEITLGTPQPSLGGRVVAASGAGTVSINASDRAPESIEVTVRLERVDGTSVGRIFTPTLTTALPGRLTLGTDRSTSTSRIRLNTYARVTNPVGGVANPDVDRTGGMRIFSVRGGIALSGGDYTADQINAMALAVCGPRSARTGACGGLVEHRRLPSIVDVSPVGRGGLADGIAGSFLHFPPEAERPAGVRCVTFPGAAANECEAFLYGFDLGGVLELDPNAYGGLLRLDPRWLPGEGFTVNGVSHDYFLRVSGLAIDLCDSGCVSRVAFSEATLTVGEGDGQALVTLAVEPAPVVAGAVTITESRGTGLAAGDYVLGATTADIAAGASEVILTVDITDDDAVERVETLTLGLSNPTGGVKGLATQQSVVLEIADNDFNDVDISFGAASYFGVEGGAVATVTVTVANADPTDTTTGPQRQVRIPITRVLRGGATDADHSGLPSAIALAHDQVEATFEVTVFDDADRDPGEELALGFGSLPQGVLAGTPATATVALIDNDSDWVAIGVTDPSGMPVTVLEPGVAVTATVTAILSLGTPVVSAGEVEVSLALPAGDVGAVGALGTVTVSLGAGDGTGSATRAITVRALADSVVEAPKAALLGGTTSGGPAGIEVVPGTIAVRDLVQQDIDDGNPLAGSPAESDIDTATVSIGSAVAAVGEGATVRLMTTIDRAVNVNVTVPWFARSNGVDVEYASGRVVFPALDAGTPVARDVLVTIADDNLNEGAETVEIVLLKPRSDVGGRVVASPDAGTVAIVPSDDISVTLSGGDWVSRGGSVVYTVALAGGVSRDEAVTVTVGHAGVGGPMTAAVYGSTGDYVVGDPAAATQAINSTLANAGDNAVVVIPAHGTEGKVTVYALEETLAPGETADTGDRLFEMFASAVRPLGSGNVSLAANPTVTTTVSGDVALTAGFASASHSVAGGGTVDVTVTLDRVADRLLHIEVIELGVPADPVSLSFSPGSREASFPVVAESDAGLFRVDIMGFGLSLPRGVSASAIPTTRVTAVHNEAVINLFAFGPGGARVAEAAGASLVGIWALTEPEVYADVGVDLAISADGTADASDYDPASLPSMDFVQSRSVAGAFRLNPTDDGIVEEDETVVVGGSGVYYDSATGRWVSLGDLLTVNAATVTIADDDTATVSVSGPATVVAEPGDGESASAVFTVTLDGMADRDVTVTLATEDGTATADEDFVGRAGGASDTVVFAAGTSGPETFTVGLSEDDLGEGDEAFGVTVVAVSPNYGGAISFLGATASATIRDEDLAVAELTVGLSLAGSHTTRVAEQDSTVPLRLTVHLGRSDSVGSVLPQEEDLEITLTVVSAVSTADADDYYGLVLPTVTILAGETSVPTDLRLDLTDNEIVEEDESIVIGGAGTSLAFNPMTVVLTDGDKAALAISAPAEAVLEPADGESVSVVFSVTLDKAADRDVTVTLATEDGTATAGDDFVGRTGTSADTVVFTAGATGPLPFTVDLVEDDEFEGDETFGVSVVAVDPDYGGAISFLGSAASATIAAPAVSLTAVAVELGVGNEVSVSWEPLEIPETEPPPTGPGVEVPPEDDPLPLTYEVQYKKADEDVWTSVEQSVAVTTVMLTGLEGGAVYDVRIRPASAGRQGRWAVTQVRTPAVNLRVLPRVAGPGNASVPLNGDDALLLFYFTQFNGLLSRPANIGLSRIIVRGLSRGRPISDAEADEIIAAASALGSGAIPASHSANLYDADPFRNHDALLLFYSVQFGGLLTRPALADLMEIVVNGVLPRGHGLTRDEMRTLIQAGRDLAGSL